MAGKKLVAYFSASGVTQKLAERLVQAVGADLYEIAPEVPYTDADLDWRDENSRSTIEMRDPSSRPAIGTAVENMGEYDEVFIGFPIWWYVAPTIINTFVETYDFAGKKIALFATSGMSGMGKTMEVLKPLAPGADWAAEQRFEASASEKELASWAAEIGM